MSLPHPAIHSSLLWHVVALHFLLFVWYELREFAIHRVFFIANSGMKLASMLAFPPVILTRAKDLIPILTTNLKVYIKEMDDWC